MRQEEDRPRGPAPGARRKKVARRADAIGSAMPRDLFETMVALGAEHGATNLCVPPDMNRRWAPRRQRASKLRKQGRYWRRRPAGRGWASPWGLAREMLDQRGMTGPTPSRTFARRDGDSGPVPGVDQPARADWSVPWPSGTYSKRHQQPELHNGLKSTQWRGDGGCGGSERAAISRARPGPGRCRGIPEPSAR